MGMDIDVLTVGAVIYLMKTSIKEGCDIRNRQGYFILIDHPVWWRSVFSPIGLPFRCLNLP